MSKYTGEPKNKKLIRTLNQQKTEAQEALTRIGQEFYDMRIQEGLTHEEIREMTGLSISTIHNLEHGKSISTINYTILLGVVGQTL